MGRCALEALEEAEAGEHGSVAANGPVTANGMYAIVFTTFPEARCSAAQMLDWHRTRSQVESVFKRFESLAQLGHLPGHDDDTAQAWLFGKLFVALLAEELISHARAISRWECDLATARSAHCLA